MFVTSNQLLQELNNSLLSSTNNLSEIISRLSTGFSVNSAKDSPADLSIIVDLNTKISSLDVAQDNIEHGMNVLSVTEDTLNCMLDLMERIKNLSLMACNDTYEKSSLDAIQDEINSSIEQIEQLNKTLQYDNVNLFQNTYILDKSKSYKNSLGGSLEVVEAGLINLDLNDESVTTMSLARNINTILSSLARTTSPESIDIEANSSLTLTIDGDEYIFTNNLSETNTINYSYDIDTKELIVSGSNYSLDCSDFANNIITINGGENIDINLKNGDNVLNLNANGRANVVAYDGNNTIIANCIAEIQLGDGNNTITSNVSDNTIVLGNGTNLLNISENTNITTSDISNLIINTQVNNEVYLSTTTNEFLLKNATNYNINVTSTQTIFDGESLDISTLMAQSNNIVLRGNSVKYQDNLGISIVDVQGDNINLELQNNNNNAVNINGRDTTIITGSGNDYISIASTGQNANISAGDGDDNIIVNGANSKIYGQDGNDTIIINEKTAWVEGGNGDNYISISSSATSSSIFSGLYYDTSSIPTNTSSAKNTIIVDSTSSNIYLDNSINEVTVNGNNNFVYTGDSNNEIVLNGDTNFVNNSNTNSTNVVDNGNNNVSANKNGEMTVLSNSGTIKLRAGESFDVTIAGKVYTLSNTMTSTGTLTYSYDSANDIITFAGVNGSYTTKNGTFTHTGETLNITAKSGQVDRVKLEGSFGEIRLGDMNDQIISNITRGKVYTESGDDTLTITSGTNSSDGRDKNFLIYETGTENDTINVNNGVKGVKVYAGSGDDVLKHLDASNYANYLYGGDGNDTMTSTTIYGYLYGEGGNDTITSSGTNAMLYGGAGNDTISSSGSSSKIYGGAGTDTISSSGTKSYLFGEEDSDTLYTNSTYNYLYGGAGNDNLTIDSINGNASVETYSQAEGEKGNDTITINGKSTNQIHYGDPANSTDTGENAGNDTFNINAQVGRVLGFGGDDKFVINSNITGEQIGLIDGGTGYDIVETTVPLDDISRLNIENIADRPPNSATLTLLTGAEYVLHFGTHQYTLKNVSSSTQNFSYTWDETNKTISFSNCTQIKITAGEGQTDNVTLKNSKNNEIYLGDNDDTITVTNNGTSYTGNKIYGGVGKDIFNISSSNIGIYGEAGDDIINMNSSDSYAYSNSSNYTISGGTGNDTITVATNNNAGLITGDADDDIIQIKGSGNAKVQGGAGNDLLIQQYNVTSTSGFENIDRNVTEASKFYIEAGVLTTVFLNGKEYQFLSDANQTITTWNEESGQLKLQMNDTTITAKGEENQNIKIVGDGNIYNGSDFVSNISVEGDNNLIIGGNNNDIFTIISGSGNTLRGNTGNDTLNINSDNNNAYGGLGKDIINMNAVNNSLYVIQGEEDSDTINISSSNSTGSVLGGEGDDIITVSGSDNINIRGEKGIDFITSTGNNNSVYGGEGNDVITLKGTNSLSSIIDGEAGGDNIIIESSNNTGIITGADGDDLITVIGGNNSDINTNDGDDVIYDYGTNNNFINDLGSDILYSQGAKNSKITGIDSIVMQKDSGSFIINEPDKSVEVFVQDDIYVIKANSANTNVKYSLHDLNLTFEVDNVEILTPENKISNLTIKGSNNRINLAESLETSLSINGDLNIVNASNGNYDITILGSENNITLSEGKSYVDVQYNSVNNVISGNNAITTVLNLGLNTTFNNCDFMIKPVEDIKLQAGIYGDEASTIKISTGFSVGRLSFNISNEEYARDSVERASSLIERITQKVTEIGSQYNRLNSVLEANEIEKINHVSSQSTLRDADIAELTSEYVKNIIIQQSSSILSVMVGNLHTDQVFRLLKAL